MNLIANHLMRQGLVLRKQTDPGKCPWSWNQPILIRNAQNRNERWTRSKIVYRMRRMKSDAGGSCFPTLATETNRKDGARSNLRSSDRTVLSVLELSNRGMPVWHVACITALPTRSS